MPKRLTQEEYIEKALEVHKGFYSYENLIYINSTKKVRIDCPIHGEFVQEANSHTQGKGCSKCRSDSINSWRAVSLMDVIKRAKNVHNSKYTYKSDIPYKTGRDKLEIYCSKHGMFTQVAADHLAGCGCPRCADEKRNKHFHNEPTILYYIYFPFLQLYKIGITLATNGVQKRYSSESQTYIILYERYYTDGKEAYIQEQQLLRKYTNYKYKGDNPFNLGGYTECYTRDVLSTYLNKNKEKL